MTREDKSKMEELERSRRRARKEKERMRKERREEIQGEIKNLKTPIISTPERKRARQEGGEWRTSRSTNIPEKGTRSPF